MSTPPPPNSHSKESKYAASIKAPQRKRIPICCLTFKIIIPRSLQESLPFMLEASVKKSTTFKKNKRKGVFKIPYGRMKFRRLSGNKKVSAPSQHGASVMELHIHGSFWPASKSLAEAVPSMALIQIILQSIGEEYNRDLNRKPRITPEIGTSPLPSSKRTREKSMYSTASVY